MKRPPPPPSDIDGIQRSVGWADVCLGLMALAATLIICLLVSCEERRAKPAEPIVPDKIRYEMGSYFVYEFHLKDGTRCISASWGGLACEWRTK